MQPAANADLAAMMGLICAVFGFVLVVGLVITIFYLLTLQKALNRVQPHNRLMEPGLVWLMFIPCFNIIWQFFIAIRVPDSLRNEFCERGADDGSGYGKGIALTTCILGIISSVINAASRGNAAFVALIISLVQLVLFILFWVKVANYSSQLASQDFDGRDYKRAFDEYDDDRGPSRRGSGGPSPETYRPGDEGYRP